MAFAVHLPMPLRSPILDNVRCIRHNCCKHYHCRDGSIVDESVMMERALRGSVFDVSFVWPSHLRPFNIFRRVRKIKNLLELGYSTVGI